MKISYQGIEGSFSHQTAKRHFPEAALLGCRTFKEAFEAVEKGEADLALLAAENTLAGPIAETLDLLSQGSLLIVGETQTRIEHHLMALPEASLESIETVISHPKALEQCLRFLGTRFQAKPHYDTAGAAADLCDAKTAAIAGKQAAKIYGLKILQENIEDNPENFTRFWLLSKKASHGKKTSYFLTLEHSPGSLSILLAALAPLGNLTQIVTRPLPGRPYEYGFTIDFVGHNPEAALQKHTKTWKLLGSYDVLS